MATNLIPFNATGFQPSASSSATVKPDQTRRSWWSPIFGWSSDPDYVSPDSSATVKLVSRSDRVAPVVFTEEKARRLRMLTQETYHDKMYHSAIASRLATEYGDKSDL